MSPVQCSDGGDAQSLGGSYDRRIDCAQWEVTILSDKSDNSYPIGRMHRLDDEFARGNVPEKFLFRTRAYS